MRYGSIGIAVSMVVMLALAAATAQATTLAHWRFEEGTVGGEASGSVLDSSGNGNHVVAESTAPTYQSDVPWNPVPLTGETNALSLSFNQSAANCLVTQAGAAVNGYNFNSTGYTIEAQFKAGHFGWNAVVNKDGLVAGNNTPFEMKLGGGYTPDPNPWGVPDPYLNKCLVEFVDGSGVMRQLLSPELSTQTWYDIAVTNNGATARMYLKKANAAGVYTLVSTNASVAGAWYNTTDVWTIGRDGHRVAGDYFDGSIDEVRISSGVLTPDRFLGSAVPEPSALVLAGTGLASLLACVWRKRA